MGVPIVYRQGSPNLISFDFADTADGTGYITYYGFRGDDGEYLTTILSTLPSEEIATFDDVATMTGSLVKKFDLDFDILFNQPQNIKGKLIASVPIGIAAVNTTARAANYQVVVVAKHFDGTTETTLATGTSLEVDSTAIATNTQSFSAMVACCICDISTLRHFKKGDTLRLTVECYFSEGTSKTLNIMVAHDPANRLYKKGNRITQGASQPPDEMELANEELGGGDVNFLSTQMIFNVPFVIPLT